MLKALGRRITYERPVPVGVKLNGGGTSHPLFVIEKSRFCRLSAREAQPILQRSVSFLTRSDFGHLARANFQERIQSGQPVRVVIATQKQLTKMGYKFDEYHGVVPVPEHRATFPAKYDSDSDVMLINADGMERLHPTDIKATFDHEMIHVATRKKRKLDDGVEEISCGVYTRRSRDGVVEKDDLSDYRYVLDEAMTEYLRVRAGGNLYPGYATQIHTGMSSLVRRVGFDRICRAAFENDFEMIRDAIEETYGVDTLEMFCRYLHDVSRTIPTASDIKSFLLFAEYGLKGNIMRTFGVAQDGDRYPRRVEAEEYPAGWRVALQQSGWRVYTNLNPDELGRLFSVWGERERYCQEVEHRIAGVFDQVLVHEGRSAVGRKCIPCLVFIGRGLALQPAGQRVHVEIHTIPDEYAQYPDLLGRAGGVNFLIKNMRFNV